MDSHIEQGRWLAPQPLTGVAKGREPESGLPSPQLTVK